MKTKTVIVPFNIVILLIIICFISACCNTDSAATPQGSFSSGIIGSTTSTTSEISVSTTNVYSTSKPTVVIDENNIVRWNGGDGVGPFFVYEPGDIIKGSALKFSEYPFYADKLFPIHIDVNFFGDHPDSYVPGDEFTYEGKTVSELEHKPILGKRRLAKRAWYELTHEEKVYQSFETIFLSFDNYWEAIATDVEKLAFYEAIEILDKAIRAHDETNLSLQKECQRLVDLGLDVYVYYGHINGLLTGDQIKNFPAKPEYGYTIHMYAFSREHF